MCEGDVSFVGGYGLFGSKWMRDEGICLKIVNIIWKYFLNSYLCNGHQNFFVSIC